MLFRQNNNPSGFSLIELIIALVVAGILCVIVYPTYRSWISNTEYKEAARRIVSTLRQVRSQAVATNMECRAQFDLAINQYRISRGDRAYNSATFTVVNDWTGFSPSVDLRGNADCSDNSSNNTMISFNPNGSCNAQYICIIDDSGNKKFRTGIPETNTGRVVIERWDAASSSWK